MKRVVCVAVAGTLAALGTPARAAPTVECVDAATSQATTIKIGDVRKAISELARQLQQANVHVLDLSDEAQEHHRTLTREAQAKQWCAAAEAAAALRATIATVHVHPQFVRDKLARLERWVRGGPWDEGPRKSAERILANAGARLSAGDHAKANAMLNPIYRILLGTKSLWDLPDELPPIEVELEGGARAEISEDDVARGCPALAKKGRGGKKDLTSVRRKLEKAMTARYIRASDLEEGDALVADLRSYLELRATWPALRVLCTLLGRAQAAEIDLGLTMARFQRVGRLRRDKDLSESDDVRFRELVRASSDAIAAQDFATAHQHLEELLVFLGEPASPAATVP